jgi:hypothetical protein
VSDPLSQGLAEGRPTARRRRVDRADCRLDGAGARVRHVAPAAGRRPAPYDPPARAPHGEFPAGPNGDRGQVCPDWCRVGTAEGRRLRGFADPEASGTPPPALEGARSRATHRVRRPENDS